ncbi:MAG TPA: NADH-quinone oxidoreductase subunit A [Nitrospirae bacterium]|nr:NADH-quinone oxidoreductase subunit A [Nitrospirota bacterium]HDY70842.1 NADH-quinone oxidoreductase subunit A [Nitrospirota bacterium]
MPGQYLPTDYLPVAIFVLISIAFGLGALMMGAIFRLRRPYPEKLMPYESGITPVGEPRFRFSIQYYVIAMLFVVFDVEAIFLYPWAIVFKKIGLFAFAEMMIFISILLVGYIYAWKKEAFTWEVKSKTPG